MRYRKGISAGFLAGIFLVTGASMVNAFDIGIRIIPELSIPVGTDSELYTLGGGGTLTGDVDLFDFFSPGLEFGVQINPVKNLEKYLNLTRIGAGVNFFLYPIPRLKLRAGGYIGGYIGSFDTSYTGSLYWKVGGQAGFRFTPTFSLLLDGGFTRYESAAEPFFSGLHFGIVADIQLSSIGRKDAGVSVVDLENIPVFPILYTSYSRSPIARIRITNKEQAEIRNVKIYFKSGNFTSGSQLCGEFPILQKGKSVDVPLYALFNEQLLSITENTKIQTEVIITYQLLNAPREEIIAKSVPINHRNALTWADDRIAAAFISPNDPAVLDFSKFAAGLIRERLRPGIDSNLQFAMGLFEGLRLSGVSYTKDLSTPYEETRKKANAVDYIQYPYQTLDYKSGDRDDLAVLFAAVFESIGIGAAYLPTDNDVLLAFSLDQSGNSADFTFAYPKDLVFQDGKTWLPLQVSSIKEGFLSSWLKGAETWRNLAATGKNSSFIPVAEAWNTYPSIGVPGVESKLVKPPEEQINNAFENTLGYFIAREIEPELKDLLSKMGADGGSGRDHNRLGLLYARYSLYPEARKEFEIAVGKGVGLALINLGNIAFLQKDFETAVASFEKALKMQPDNKAALTGLARAKYELDLFADADELYSQLKNLDPELANRYSYLSSSLDSTSSRASAVSERSRNILWSEDE